MQHHLDFQIIHKIHQLTFYNQTGIFIEVADTHKDLIGVVKYLTELKIERMGEKLTLDGIALSWFEEQKEG